METNSWRKVFEVYYRPGWRKERKNFEAALEFRRKNPGPRARRPSGIGAVIWQIIGARDEAVVTAARRLGCTVGQIKDVLYGGRQTAEAWVRWYHWKEKLALHYPLAWNNYAEEFEKRLAGESRRRSCGIGAPGNDRSQSPDAPAEPSGLTS